MDKRCYICGSSRHLCGQCPKRYSVPEEDKTSIGRPHSRRYSDYRDHRNPRSGKNDSYAPSRSKQDGSCTNEETTGYYRNDTQPHVDSNRGNRRVKRYCTICRRYGHGTRDCWYNKTNCDDDSNLGSSSRRLSQYGSNDAVDCEEPRRRHGDQYKHSCCTPPPEPAVNVGSNKTATFGKQISKPETRRAYDCHEKAPSSTLASDGCGHKLRDRQPSAFTDSSTSDDNKSHSSRLQSEKTLIKNRLSVNPKRNVGVCRARNRQRHTGILDNSEELSPYDSEDFQSERCVNTSSDESILATSTHRRPRREQTVFHSPSTTKADIRSVDSDQDGSCLLRCEPGNSISLTDNSALITPSSAKIVNGTRRDLHASKSQMSGAANSCSDESVEHCTKKMNSLRLMRSNNASKIVRNVVLPSVKESTSSESNDNGDSCNDNNFGVSGPDLSGSTKNNNSLSASRHSKPRLFNEDSLNNPDCKRVHREDSRSEQEKLGLYPLGRHRLDRFGKRRTPMDRGSFEMTRKDCRRELANDNCRRVYPADSGSNRRIVSNSYGKRHSRPSAATKRFPMSPGGGGLLEVYSPNEVTCYNCGRTGHKSFDCPESGINRQRLR